MSEADGSHLHTHYMQQVVSDNSYKQTVESERRACC